MSVVDDAVRLAEQGLAVFPCAPNKRPTCPSGFKDAVSDVAAVRKLWQRHPGALIGVPTGIASGFDILDIDPRHGGDRWWWQHKAAVPATWMHRTGGGGLHVLFEHVEPVRNTSSKLAPGVDTRGEGGYLIWWPAHGCQVEQAPIVPWPSWLLEELLRKPEPAKPSAYVDSGLDTDDRVQRLVARVLDRVARADEGQRHYLLRKGAYTIGGVLDRLPMTDAEAKERLVAAVAKAGAVDLVNARKTAAWGLECGRRAPLRPRARA